MKICWLWCELKLLLADITRSVRLSGEVMRVSQHFGMLTIEFSRWLVELVARAVDRYDEIAVLRRELLAAGVCYGVVLGKERIAADRLLLISSIDLGESAGEIAVLRRELLAAGVCYGVVLISWNGVVLKGFVRLLLLVVAAEFYEGKREDCCR
ncbi:hypothetical protein F511_16055 [Dorcoceras hygrometricum]|uniref:Uncharacterized protein n=1 Tax=Dorcoceras hygrometricum TaxID=472368 RepID=A0A2Z7DDM8_9LAMI|nr:hypothetical protein F511_16055 [Dorcoceras hygrometricum]